MWLDPARLSLDERFSLNAVSLIKPSIAQKLTFFLIFPTLEINIGKLLDYKLLKNHIIHFRKKVAYHAKHLIDSEVFVFIVFIHDPIRFPRIHSANL